MSKKIISLVLTFCILLSSFAIGSFSVSAVKVEPSSAVSSDQGPQDEIQGSAVLHCFNWSYNNIKNNLQAIADAGYTAVQTSPVQQPKDYGSSNDVSGQWWKLYQPLTFTIASNSWLGTQSDLTNLCVEAHKKGIKVIVDIVANHMADNGSSGTSMSNINGSVDSELRNDSNCWHINNIMTTTDEDRHIVTHGSIGQPDLNTGNSKVINKVKNLLVSCVNCGVDGFRFDAAKHIELPSDEYGSQFWPTVLNGATAATTRSLYFYGEILNYSGVSITNYTQYMSVTDNYAGDRALVAAKNRDAATLAKDEYTKGGNTADDTVLWVESHDTYMGNDAGSGGLKNTSGVSNEDIVKAWAIVGSRQGATALFFARPASQMGAVSSDSTWKSKSVSEVNKFKNYFAGQPEKLSYKGDCVYNERGTSGLVISKLSGSGSVSLDAERMADGTYTDQVSGGTFTVSGGVISGTVGSSGVAVVYNLGPGRPTASATPGSSVFKADTLQLTLNCYYAEYGEYTIDGGAYQRFTDGQKITIGADKDFGSEITVRVRAVGGGETSDTVSYTYKKVDPNREQKLYFDNSSYNWSSVYAYIYGDNDLTNGDWPGQKMTRDSATGYYVITVPEDLQNGSVIFAERGDSTTNRYPANKEPGLPLEEKDKIFVAGHQLIDYTGQVSPTTNPVPYTAQMLYFDNSSYSWTSVYAYIYAGDTTPNAEWPGQKMTLDSSLGYYKLEVPSELKDGYVIFSQYGDNNKRYPAHGEPGLPLQCKDKIFIAGNQLVDYPIQQQPTTVQPTTVKPTTQPVTTVKPTTQPVTTVKPTTQPVTTVKPTTQPVTTVKPTTQPVTTVKPTTQPVTTVPSVSFLIGDPNLDGVINIKDATMVQRIAAQIIAPTSNMRIAADVDKNGVVSIMDVTLIQKYIAKLSDCGSCGTYYGSAPAPTTAPATVKPTTQPATEPEPTDPTLDQDFYLIGFFNGKSYGDGDDYANLGDCHFVNNQVCVQFATVSYACVKTATGTWYMTNGFPGVGVSSAELFNTSVTGENSEKLMVPAGTYTFTLVKTGEDSYTLSYEEGGSNPIVIPGGGEDPSDPTNPDPGGTYTVKFTKPDGWGETLYCYYWTGTSAGPVDWPGSPMTFDSTNDFGQAVYAFEVPSSYENIIFTDGSNQTPDIATSCSPMGYWLNGTTVETWDIGGNNPVNPTNPNPTGTYTVKFTKPDSWSDSLNCYYWTGTSSGPVDWPGSAMTFDSTNDYGQSVYAFEVPSSYEKIIFNDGSNQTPDITTSCSPMGYWLNGTTVETWDISDSGSGSGGGQQGGDDPQPSGTYTVRFTKPNGWNGANCYYWQTGSDGPIGWPGAEMTWETQNGYGEQVYKIDIPSNCNMIIFSDNGANQTDDITTSCSDCGYWLNNGVPTLWE